MEGRDTSNVYGHPLPPRCVALSRVVNTRWREILLQGELRVQDSDKTSTWEEMTGGRQLEAFAHIPGVSPRISIGKISIIIYLVADVTAAVTGCEKVSRNRMGGCGELMERKRRCLKRRFRFHAVAAPLLAHSPPIIPPLDRGLLAPVQALQAALLLFSLGTEYDPDILQLPLHTSLSRPLSIIAASGFDTKVSRHSVGQLVTKPRISVTSPQLTPGELCLSVVCLLWRCARMNKNIL
jgi:hypothetical protein